MDEGGVSPAQVQHSILTNGHSTVIPDRLVFITSGFLLQLPQDVFHDSRSRR